MKPGRLFYVQTGSSRLLFHFGGSETFENRNGIDEVKNLVGAIVIRFFHGIYTNIIYDILIETPLISVYTMYTAYRAIYRAIYTAPHT